MVDKLMKVGIAGYGVVGKRRRQYIDVNPHLHTTAICDINYSVERPCEDGVIYLSSYKSLLEQNLDILFVCLPNYLAAEATMAGLERGLHVFCEKPPGRSVKDIIDVIDIHKKYPDLKLKYGFNHRYHESVKKAKEIIDSEKYGKVISVRGIYGKSSIIPFDKGWRSERKYAGGGILLDQGIHMLDMILYFVGDFDEIKSFVSNDYWNHDVEDNAYAIMRNKTGCVAMIHSTATQWQHRFRLELTLEDALLELTGILSGSKSYGEEKLRLVPKENGSSVGSITERYTSYLEDNSWRDEVNEFASAIVNNKTIESGTSTDALKVMELVYKIYCADSQWQQQFNISHP